MEGMPYFTVTTMSMDSGQLATLNTEAQMAGDFLQIKDILCSHSSRLFALELVTRLLRGTLREYLVRQCQFGVVRPETGMPSNKLVRVLSSL